MNDRFKFRYWHTKENKYIYTQCDCLAIMNTVLYSLISKPNRGGWYETDIEKAYNNFELIPEQCTGLRDKNGNLIYEGDLLGGLPVVWVKELNGFMVKVNTIHGWDWHCIIEFTNQEITGNIHEQAEQGETK